MPQTKMNPTWTLFPDFVALVPLEAIAGNSATITNFSEITKENSFVINDESADTDLLMSEDGLTMTYTRTGAAVQGFDEGGLGDIDDVTVQRELLIEIGVNGFSHDILAILVGLDPATDINESFQFLKDDATGVFAAGVQMRGAIKKKKYLFVARVPLELAVEGNLYFIAPKTVVMDQDFQHLMINDKVTYTLPLKGLKMVNTEHLEDIQAIFEAVTNGYELLFSFNAADEEYTY